MDVFKSVFAQAFKGPKYFVSAVSLAFLIIIMLLCVISILGTVIFMVAYNQNLPSTPQFEGVVVFLGILTLLAIFGLWASEMDFDDIKKYVVKVYGTSLKGWYQALRAFCLTYISVAMLACIVLPLYEASQLVITGDHSIQADSPRFLGLLVFSMVLLFWTIAGLVYSDDHIPEESD